MSRQKEYLYMERESEELRDYRGRIYEYFSYVFTCCGDVPSVFKIEQKRN